MGLSDSMVPGGPVSALQGCIGFPHGITGRSSGCYLGRCAQAGTAARDSTAAVALRAKLVVSAGRNPAGRVPFRVARPLAVRRSAAGEMLPDHTHRFGDITVVRRHRGAVTGIPPAVTQASHGEVHARAVLLSLYDLHHALRPNRVDRRCADRVTEGVPETDLSPGPARLKSTEMELPGVAASTDRRASPAPAPYLRRFPAVCKIRVRYRRNVTRLALVRLDHFERRHSLAGDRFERFPERRLAVGYELRPVPRALIWTGSVFTS